MDGDTYEKIRAFVDANPIATLSTINDDGSPHGAVVYVCSDDEKRIIHFLTKLETRKYKNLTARDRVALTIVNPAENSTLQAAGHAVISQDVKIIDKVVQKVTRVHASAPDWLPPLAKIKAGPYAIVSVHVDTARLAEFQGKEIGDARIFTQV